MHCRAGFIGRATLPVDHWAGLRPAPVSGAGTKGRSGRAITRGISLLPHDARVWLAAEVADSPDSSIRVGFVGDSVLSLANSKPIVAASGSAIQCEWNVGADAAAHAWASLRGRVVQLEFELQGNATVFVYSIG